METGTKTERFGAKLLKAQKMQTKSWHRSANLIYPIFQLLNTARWGAEATTLDIGFIETLETLGLRGKNHRIPESPYGEPISS